MKFKLSPVFMLTVISMAFFFPALLGISFETVAVSAAVVVASALMVERAPVQYRGPMRMQFGKVGADDIAQEYEKVQANLKQVGDELKAFAEQSQKQIKEAGKMSEETKNSVDKLLVEQGELRARLQAAEQLTAKLEAGGMSGPEVKKTMGQLVALADEYVNFKGKGSVSIDVSAAITSVGGSGGALIEPQRVPGIVAPPQRRLTIRDLLNWGTTASNSIEFVRETGFTNNADVVSENPASGKPESNITFEVDSAPVATVAHWVHASRQVITDAGMLTSYIDGRLRYGLDIKEELQLLKGSGVGLNMNGIYTQASAYANPGVTVQAETQIDRLRLALLQAELAEYYADGIVLNPIDWAGIELTKDQENRYIFAMVQGMVAPALWGRPIVSTQSMDASEFLVGAFAMGAQGWDREQTTVTISTEDRDNLIKNMVTILAEKRLALTVYRPEAFVKGSFADLVS